mgnify:CR=1 FL=1
MGKWLQGTDRSELGDETVNDELHAITVPAAIAGDYTLVDLAQREWDA